MVSWSVISAEEGSTAVPVVLQQGLPSGSLFAVGKTDQIFTATDAHGNIATCKFSVTIIGECVIATELLDLMISCVHL